ncbi:tripartite tricarboxylate transporter TctB family protein [Aliamphritea spongicola]|nr:tripartite tricarboxylate transporter TctB family protein [Aliamphritea spongicola]
MEDKELIVTNGYGGIFIYIGIFIAYWLLVPVLGFLVTTPFVMFSVALLLGGRNWIPITAVSVITPILIFMVPVTSCGCFCPPGHCK